MVALCDACSCILLQSLSSSAPFLAYLEQLRSMAEQLSALPPPHPSLSAPPDMPGLGSLHRMSSHEFVSSLLQLVGPQQQAHSASDSPLSGIGSSSSLNPAQFLALLKMEAHGKFQHFNQEDAHELWNVLMDILERKAAHTQARWRAAMQQRQQRQGASNSETGAVREPDMDGLESLLDDAARIIDDKLKQSAAATVAAVADAPQANGASTEDASVADTDSESDSPAADPNALHSSGEHAAFAFSSAAASAPVPAVASSPPSSSASLRASSSSAAAAPAVPDPLSFPSDPFLGLQAHFLMCQTCQSPSSAGVRHTPFNSLTLSFPYGAPPAPTRLEHLLGESVRAEIIDSVRCEKCNWTERMKLLQREVQEAASAGEKGPKARRYASLLTRLLEETRSRSMLLQPNAGQLLEQRARDYIAKAKGAAPLAAEANGHSEEQKDGPAQPAQAAPTPSASPDFLNPAPRCDGALSATPGGNDNAWSELVSLFSAAGDPTQCEEFLARMPRRAEAFLRALVALDTRRKFSKSAAVSRLPRALCFHLNRLVGHTKLSQFVSFPPTLSMAPFTATWLCDEQSTDMQQSESGTNAANYLRHKQMRMMQRSAGTGSHAQATASTPEEIAALQLYELDAVVVHQGSAAGGHYVAYRRQVQLVRNGNGNGNGHASANGHHAKATSNSAPVAPAPANSTLEFAPSDAAPASTSEPASGIASAAVPPVEPSNESAGSSNGTDGLFSLDASSPSPVSSSNHSSPPREVVSWWYMSDEARRLVSLDEVLAAQAYLVLYREKTPPAC